MYPSLRRRAAFFRGRSFFVVGGRGRFLVLNMVVGRILFIFFLCSFALGLSRGLLLFLSVKHLLYST